MKKIFLLLATVSTFTLFSQNVGINATGVVADASAALDIASANKGLLIPRVALTAINVAAPVTSPLTSLLVYNTSAAGTGTNAVIAGYYYWDGAKWVRLQTTASTSADWSTTGNAGTAAATNFIGTTDNVGFVLRTNNTERMRITSNGNVSVGPAAANASALLDVQSTNKGFLMPRVALLSNTDVVTIASPATGLQVYNTNYTGTLSTGICYFDGTKWLNVSTYLPSGSGYFVQNAAFTVPNNGSLQTIPFGTIIAPQSGIYSATVRTFAAPIGAIAGSLPIDQTAFYYSVYVNGVFQETVEYYLYKTQVIATSSTLRYTANAGDVVTFGYQVAVGYSLDFTTASFFSRNNVVISKVQ